MLLSDLIKSDNVPDSVYGVEVDVESFSPPTNIKSIGFVFAMEGDDISMTLIDTIISYHLAGVEVLVEVPAEVKCPEAKYMISVANNAGFSISLLPPQDLTPEAIEAYRARLCDFTEVYFKSQSFSKHLLPVTSYFAYMITEVVGDVSDFKPTDDYVNDAFHQKVPVAISDDLKVSMRAKTYETLGGKDNFDAFAKSLVGGVYRKVINNITDMEKQRAPTP